MLMPTCDSVGFGSPSKLDGSSAHTSVSYSNSFKDHAREAARSSDYVRLLPESQMDDTYSQGCPTARCEFWCIVCADPFRRRARLTVQRCS